MRSLFTFTRETKIASAIGGMLSRPAATIVIAGSLSAITLAASFYIVMFAGRDLLPSPPVTNLSAARLFEPIPMNSLPAIAPTVAVEPILDETVFIPEISAVGTFAAAVVTPAIAPAIAPAAAPVAAPTIVAGVDEAPSSVADNNGRESDEYSVSLYSVSEDYSVSHFERSRNNEKKDKGYGGRKDSDRSKSSRHYD